MDSGIYSIDFDEISETPIDTDRVCGIMAEKKMTWKDPVIIQGIGNAKNLTSENKHVYVNNLSLKQRLAALRKIVLGASEQNRLNAQRAVVAKRVAVNSQKIKQMSTEQINRILKIINSRLQRQGVLITNIKSRIENLKKSPNTENEIKRYMNVCNNIQRNYNRMLQTKKALEEKLSSLNKTAQFKGMAYISEGFVPLFQNFIDQSSGTPVMYTPARRLENAIVMEEDI